MKRTEDAGRGGAPARVGAAVYVAVWGGLLGLTALAVALAGAPLGGLPAPVALLIAAARAVLVGWFLMHLGFQGTRLYVALVSICLAVLAVFVGLTLVDVLARARVAGTVSSGTPPRWLRRPSTTSSLSRR